MLEATKLRQSREIKELRRKLRDTRHMPSRLLYPNSETLSPTTSDLSLPNQNHSSSSPSSDEEELEPEPEPDPVYDRIVRLVDGLLSQAHRAIERTIDDCMPVSTNTVKVLSAAEVQQYERRVLGLPDEDEEGSKREDGKLSDADVSLDDDEQKTESKEKEDAAYLGEDDNAKRRLSSFSFGRRRQSILKPPD